jgi:hypothetical protein
LGASAEYGDAEGDERERFRKGVHSGNREARAGTPMEPRRTVAVNTGVREPMVRTGTLVGCYGYNSSAGELGADQPSSQPDQNLADAPR